MPRRPRQDTPARWHHVMNRAIARRSLFETDADIRFFLSKLARAARSGRIEVHAWCVLTTHFHLLVRCPTGELGAVMQQAQGSYARSFNRTRRRDGPLHRGRFVSKPVDSLTYRKALVAYIDGNAIAAGMCSQPWEYPWCSARQYVSGKGPAWLQRDWVEGWICERRGTREYQAASYVELFDPRIAPRIAGIVAARMEANSREDDLDSLLGKASPAVLKWLRRKAQLADGTAILQPYVAPDAISEKIAALRSARGKWAIKVVATGRRHCDGWLILHAGLLRSLAGSSYVQIAARLGVSAVHASRLSTKHKLLLNENELYAEVAADTAREVLASTYELIR